MKIINYNQFSKKTLLIGVDRAYFMILLMLFAILTIINVLFATVFIVIVYSVSVYLFFIDNYFFEKIILHYNLSSKYKQYFNIIGR